MATSLTITGRPIATTAAALSSGQPAILDGLQIRWGRQTQVDQPQASTLTARVAISNNDSVAAATIADLRVGHPLECSTTVDKKIASGTNNVTITSTGLKVNNAAVTDLTGRAAISPQNAAAPVTVDIGPGAFQVAGENPAAWDNHPQTQPGQVWDYKIYLSIPASAKVTAYPLLFTGPWTHAAAPLPMVAAVTSEAGKTVLTGSFTTTTAWQWVGVRVVINPTGPTWAEMPGSWDEQTQTWSELALTQIYSAAHIAPAGPYQTKATVFAGRIAAAEVEYSNPVRGPIITITATDILTELAGTFIGDKPFPKESAARRIRRVMDLTGIPNQIASAGAPMDRLVSWQDVDRRPALDLLLETVISLGCVLWPSAHTTTGAYLALENPSLRISLSKLGKDSSGQAIITGASGNGLVLDASSIERTSARITQDNTDAATVVRIGWQEQLLSDSGQAGTETHTYVLSDAARRAQYGEKAYQVSTLLTTQADAAALAATLMRRTDTTGWRLTGLSIPMKVTRQKLSEVFELLDATNRIGAPVTVTNLPSWIPDAPALPAFVEGGEYTATGGSWDLSLDLTRATSEGKSVAWNETPTEYTWETMGAISWNALTGVGP